MINELLKIKYFEIKRLCINIMPVIEIKTVEEFESVMSIPDFMPTSYVFIDFYATWCGPCKKIAPFITELSNIYDCMIFIKIDIENIPKLSELYNIRAMPTFIILRQGNLQPVCPPIVGADINVIKKTLELLIKTKNIGKDF